MNNQEIHDKCTQLILKRKSNKKTDMGHAELALDILAGTELEIVPAIAWLQLEKLAETHEAQLLEVYLMKIGDAVGVSTSPPRECIMDLALIALCRYFLDTAHSRGIADLVLNMERQGVHQEEESEESSGR